MRLLSFQPFSLFTNGGGSRILRRLYLGHEFEVVSLVVSQDGNFGPIGNIKEIFILASPIQREWMRWKMRMWVTWLRYNIFRMRTVNQIREAAKNIPHDILHVVNHGPFSNVLCDDAIKEGKTIWVSFHDHFLTCDSSFEVTNELWIKSERRFLISNEMGWEYQRLFGNKPFELITDGVFNSEISKPQGYRKKPLIVYFAGLLHIDYLPLFQCLANALDLMSGQGFHLKLVLRGTQDLPFLKKRTFEVEYRPFTVDYNELKVELDTANILYLPIKFSIPDFYLYSLSTKMVGYLGGSGTILYHGPKNSAVAKLLDEYQSAILCTSIDLNEMVKSLITLVNSDFAISSNAKSLAKSKFDMIEIQDAFWFNNIPEKTIEPTIFERVS